MRRYRKWGTCGRQMLLHHPLTVPTLLLAEMTLSSLPVLSMSQHH